MFEKLLVIDVKGNNKKILETSHLTEKIWLILGSITLYFQLTLLSPLIDGITIYKASVNVNVME